MDQALARIGVQLQEIAGRARALTGWRRAACAFAAGVLGALALAPFYALPLLGVAFTAFIILLDGAADSARPRLRAFASGWWFGFGYFLAGVYWMAFSFFVQADQFAWMAPIAVTAMPAGLALFSGAAALVCIGIWRPGWQRIILFAAVFSVFEYLRGHILTGLPWNLSGQALAGTAAGAQTAAWYGAYGLSFVVIAIAGSAAAGLSRGVAPRRTALWGAAPVIGVVVLFAVGFARLSLALPQPEQPDAYLRIVQPNINQRDKINPDKWGDNFYRNLEFSLGDLPDGASDGAPLLVIWPENAAPLLDEADTALDILATELPQGASLIAGAVRRSINADNTYRYYNALAVVEGFASGDPSISHYDKHHLVPFGEYLPFYDLLNAIGLAQLTPYGDAGFAAGEGPAVLSASGIKFSPLICYEAIFPGAVYPDGERPQLIITVTNDAWFGDTSGPRQHLDQARLRSIETGLPMARSANTGVSALIDAHGQVLARIPLYDGGSINAALPRAISPPIYDRVGDALYFLMIACALAAGLWGHILSRAVGRRLQPLRDTVKKP